jgi:hypothetical protein
MPDTPVALPAPVTWRRAARAWPCLATLGALLAVAAPGSAQRVAQARAGVAWTPMAVGPRPAEPGNGVMPTREEWRLIAVMPFFGAAGAQLLGSPTAWDRTWAGYGYRLGDQVGFLLVEEGLKRGLRAAVGPAAPARSCWRDDRAWLAALAQGAGCAIVGTFVERSPDGGRRLNVPTVVSVLGATGASLAWRPERTNAAKAQSFLLVRTGIVFGGLSASRLFDDWRERDAPRDIRPSSPMAR